MFNKKKMYNGNEKLTNISTQNDSYVLGSPGGVAASEYIYPYSIYNPEFEHPDKFPTRHVYGPKNIPTSYPKKLLNEFPIAQNIYDMKEQFDNGVPFFYWVKLGLFYLLLYILFYKYNTKFIELLNKRFIWILIFVLFLFLLS